MGYTELPIACVTGYLFLQRSHYAPDGERYHFILDWPTALDPRSGRRAPSEFKLMAGQGRHTDPRHQIIEGAEFLRAHPRFLLLQGPNSAWLERVLQTGAYRLTLLRAETPLDWPLWLVEKVDA